MLLCCLCTPSASALGAPSVRSASQVSWPIAPRALAVEPASVPGFARSKPELEETTSAVDWAEVILGDTPLNGLEEIVRLGTEGFLEGVHEWLVDRSGESFSAALVLGSNAAARKELGTKVSEELQEFGKGGGYFPVRRVAAAVGIDQPNPRGFRVRGLYPATVLIVSGRCLLAVGAMLDRAVSRPRTRDAAVDGLVALLRRAKPLCAEPQPALASHPSA